MVKRAIADADLALVHSLGQEEERSTVVADAFRVESGEIVERLRALRSGRRESNPRNQFGRLRLYH